MNATPMAWHYTIGDRADGILLDGMIKPAVAGVPSDESPCVWFSSQPKWEPTANKMMVEANSVKKISFTEMRKVDGGLWRFGLPISDLLNWRKIQIATGMTQSTITRLTKVAKKDGGDPFRWYGSLEPVPMSNCTVQRLIDKAWITTNP
jgi:hypothetical protein